MNYRRKLGPSSQQRVNFYLDRISEELIEIQEELAAILPAKVQLSKIHVNSIEELALLPYAKEQGLPYKSISFDYSLVKPPCPICGDKSKIIKVKSNTYICKNCNKKYTPNKNSILSGSKMEAIVWMNTLLCLLEGYTIDRTCKLCNYAPKTYYALRNRIFYAIKLFMDEVKLYGNIQCDNTEVRISFKGKYLKDTDYPEDSPFYIEDFIPRPARKRGGRYKQSELNMNKIPIFTAIDSYGHVLARQAGIGATTYSTIDNAVGKNKILLSVPKEDPFKYSKTSDVLEYEGTDTLLISDGELSIKKYAERCGLKHESHVYRRDGKQVKLSKEAHDIQKVNYIHKELKNFLSRTNISTKYLPGYLSLFEFKINTGATDAAIEHLFEILATPGLGKTAEFYENLFKTPNYIVEWSKKDSPLKKFDYNQLYCAYLYHKKKEGFDTEIKIDEITEETGYSKSSIRRIYKNFVSSGLMDDIIEHFEGDKPKKKKEWPPELVAMLKEYAENCALPFKARKTQQEFLDDANKRYNTSYKRTNFINYINQSKEMGLDFGFVARDKRKVEGVRYSNDVMEKGRYYVQRYDEIYKEGRANNINLSKKQILNQIAQEQQLSYKYVRNIYYYVLSTLNKEEG